MNVTINQEQRLFVNEFAAGYSCLGFDVCYRDAAQLASLLKATPPDPGQIGTLAQFEQHQRLINSYALRPDLNQKTWFTPGTPAPVQELLEQARHRKTRLRLFFGEPETGKCWLEEWDVIGQIGRSMGPQRLPILLESNSSTGGGAILTACIVRIMNTDCVDLWRHPQFHLPTFTVHTTPQTKYPTAVHADGELVARFPGEVSARRWIAFMEGRTLKR